MLRRLLIENFILIRDLEIEFEEGLNVISGETGTGKSMTISAVEFVMGKQGDYPEGSAVEMELEEGGESLLLRREIRNRRSRYYLNGRGTTAGTVREILEERISLQGQNEFVKLLRSDFQREVLDRFGNLEDLREEVERLYNLHREVEGNLAKAQNRLRELEQRRDYVEFRIREVEEVGVSPEEAEGLKERAELLGALEKIGGHLSTAYRELHGDEGSASSKVGEALRHLLRVRDLDPSLDPLLEKLSALREELEEVALELREKSVIPPREEIDRVNEKLFHLQRLERKYGRPYREILREVELLREELLSCESLLEEIESLERRRREIGEKLLRTCGILTEARKKAAISLSEEVKGILRDLNLGEAEFRVSVEEAEPTRSGADRIRFLFSSYRGELKPLGEIASGGELTRLFLALALVLPPAETYIFDEVDVGVSGETSVKLARLLRKLSRRMQVIVITHSAPVCAAGDLNLVTEKEFLGGIPYVQIRRLGEEEKLREIARLMGTTTENTLRGARELVELVNS